MKVVLFCGGLGLRIRNGSEDRLPKALVTIGNRPILWHVMRYYAHFGHTDFILCLGFGGVAIREYVQRDPDLRQWRITLLDTGEQSSIGERLSFTQSHLRDEEMFLANYADGLTDLNLSALIDALRASSKIGAFVSTRPALSYHFVHEAPDGTVLRIDEGHHADLRINGGFFVFRRAIFDYLDAGDDLVSGAFRRLVPTGGLLGYRYDGFWKAMDTFKDRQELEDLYAGGRPPWAVWRNDLHHRE